MNKIEKRVIQRIMDEAIQLQKQSEDQCCEFTILTSHLHPQILILRWLSIDISNIDQPTQHYQYQCFYPDGSKHNCEIHYTNQEDTNAFFSSLQSHYQQPFARTHQLKKTCIN